MRKQNEKQERQTRGQGLVELALVFPILLMFFVGLIEVGWALHSYLVLVNANREGARFAARGQHFYEANVDITNRVIAERVWAAMSDQAEVAQTTDDPPQLVEEGGNLTIFVHRFYIATEQPGNPTDDVLGINNGETTSTCSGAAALDTEGSFRLGATTNRHGEPQNSQINLEMYCLELVTENDEFNTQLDALFADENLPYSVNEVIVVETIYQHEMALKVPFFTAIIPDPIPMSISTQMRITGERSLES